jgi:hypothetical protein
MAGRGAMQRIADRGNSRAEPVKAALLQHFDQRDGPDARVVIAVVIAAKKAVAIWLRSLTPIARYVRGKRAQDAG